MRCYTYTYLVGMFEISLCEINSRLALINRLCNYKRVQRMTSCKPPLFLYSPYQRRIDCDIVRYLVFLKTLFIFYIIEYCLILYVNVSSYYVFVSLIKLVFFVLVFYCNLVIQVLFSILQRDRIIVKLQKYLPNTNSIKVIIMSLWKIWGKVCEVAFSGFTESISKFFYQ